MSVQLDIFDVIDIETQFSFKAFYGKDYILECFFTGRFLIDDGKERSRCWRYFRVFALVSAFGGRARSYGYSIIAQFGGDLVAYFADIAGVIGDVRTIIYGAGGGLFGAYRRCCGYRAFSGCLLTLAALPRFLVRGTAAAFALAGSGTAIAGGAPIVSLPLFTRRAGRLLPAFIPAARLTLLSAIVPLLTLALLARFTLTALIPLLTFALLSAVTLPTAPVLLFVFILAAAFGRLLSALLTGVVRFAWRIAVAPASGRFIPPGTAPGTRLIAAVAGAAGRDASSPLAVLPGFPVLITTVNSAVAHIHPPGLPVRQSRILIVTNSEISCE